MVTVGLAIPVVDVSGVPCVVWSVSLAACGMILLDVYRSALDCERAGRFDVDAISFEFE